MVGFNELNDRKYFILTTTNCHILPRLTVFFRKSCRIFKIHQISEFSLLNTQILRSELDYGV